MKIPSLKKHRKTGIILSVLAVAWSLFTLYSNGSFGASADIGHPRIEKIIKDKQSPNDALTLVTEPEDGTKTVIDMIDSAKTSVDLVMYTLNDKAVEAALEKAETRGVSVRVLLNGGYKGQEPPSKKSTTTFDRVKAAGVPVRWSQSYFDLTHQKTLVTDNNVALIMTGNLDRTYYKKDRDFQIADTDAADVAAIESAFDSDWNGTHVAADDGTDLIWSPGSEAELIALINNADTSLLVYNEEMADEPIEDALSAAARRGVDVEVCMSMDTGWLSAFSALRDAGVHISTFDSKAPVYVHAKMILADGKLAFLGSENFSGGSLNANRELGLLLSKPDIISALSAQFEKDFTAATPF